MVSLVFSSDKHLNLELASDLCEYLGLSDSETDYFFLLLNYQRAGTERLKRKLLARVLKAQDGARKISQRVVIHKELDSEERAIFYSSWVFTGVRNLLAIPHPWSAEEIAKRLKIDLVQAQNAISFLVEKGLVRLESGRYEIAARATHLGAEHPLAAKHHQNWRLRAMQKMDWRASTNLFYTGPMSLGVADSEKVHAMLLDFLQNVNKLVVDSPSETVRCLNFDWFEY